MRRSEILVKWGVVVSLCLLSGCDVAHSMRDDLARLTASAPAPQKPSPRPSSPRRAAPQSAAAAATPYDMPPAPPATATAASAAAETPSAKPAASPPLILTGKSESELRTMLGSPTREEERPPGKRWHYRTGQCTLDVQLYPDVQTKQFGTLAYEVKSDDNTDEGKRLCLAQLQSRAHGGN